MIKRMLKGVSIFLTIFGLLSIVGCGEEATEEPDRYFLKPIPKAGPERLEQGLIGQWSLTVESPTAKQDEAGIMIFTKDNRFLREIWRTADEVRTAREKGRYRVIDEKTVEIRIEEIFTTKDKGTKLAKPLTEIWTEVSISEELEVLRFLSFKDDQGKKSRWGLVIDITWALTFRG